MKDQKQLNSKATKANPDPFLLSYMTIRRCIGFLGIFMPLSLIVWNFIFGSCHEIQKTISNYFYTTSGNVLVGALCAVALFLITYKGYDRKDHIASNLAGIFALGIALFPTASDPLSHCAIFSLDNSQTARTATHLISATLFFITLSYISLFLFTKSSGHKTKQKVERNKVYKICGYTMLASIVIIGMLHFDPFNAKFGKYNPVFWCEWIALFAFGFSWLTKGEFLLKDN